MSICERVWIWEHRDPRTGEVQRGVMFHEPEASRAMLDRVEEFVPVRLDRAAILTTNGG
jgi:hypothetical protein